MPPSAPTSFSSFPCLPAEIRLKIWHHTFQPRVVEIHARRAHYANEFQHSGIPKWQSGCINPAALSVNLEARAAALEFYAVKFPLATIASCEHAGDSIADPSRVLYVNTAIDTVAVLGDLDYRRMSTLFTDWRRYDPTGLGLTRLAISASWTYHQGAGDSIRMLMKHMFPELNQLTVFMSMERIPPADWPGGGCSLDDCTYTDSYKRYAMGKGSEMRNGDKWMIVGKNEIRVMDLNFRVGW